MDQRTFHQNKAAFLSEIYNNLILEWATGTGKTLGVIKCIEVDESEFPWYIITPEVLQAENLKREITKRGYGHLLKDTIKDILCYASFDKLKNVGMCNIFFDEVHRLSELKVDIAQEIKYQRIFAASATIPSIVRERLESLGEFYTYKIPLHQAIEEGILPEPKVYIHWTYPNDTIKRNLTGPKKKQWLTTDLGYIQSLDDSIEYWRKMANKLRATGKDNDWCYSKMSSLGLQRKKFVSSTKTEDVRNLIGTSIEGKRRFICFTGSINQCDQLGGNYAVHSKKGKKQNIATLENFNSYNIDRIYTHKMGREGLNLEGIECGIITQLSSGNDDGLEFIQICGRMLRSYMPEIHVFVAKGTKDEEYLEKALLVMDNKYVEYV